MTDLLEQPLDAAPLLDLESEFRPPVETPVGPRVLLAVLLGAAAAIHFAMVPAHAAEWRAEGVAFILSAWVQAVLAIAVVVRPTRRWLQRGGRGQPRLHRRVGVEPHGRPPVRPQRRRGRIGHHRRPELRVVRGARRGRGRGAPDPAPTGPQAGGVGAGGRLDHPPGRHRPHRRGAGVAHGRQPHPQPRRRRRGGGRRRSRARHADRPAPTTWDWPPSATATSTPTPPTSPSMRPPRRPWPRNWTRPAS